MTFSSLRIRFEFLNFVCTVLLPSIHGSSALNSVIWNLFLASFRMNFCRGTLAWQNDCSAPVCDVHRAASFQVDSKCYKTF